MFSAQRGKGDLPVQGKVHPAPAALLLTGADGGTWGCDIDKDIYICQCELISEYFCINKIT